jgi:tetratricopeptide (TPR) repeat protein
MVTVADVVTEWVVGALLDAGVKFVRSSSYDRAVRQAVGHAIEMVTEQAPAQTREALRDSLYWCFSSPPVVRIDGSTTIAQGLRLAIAAQLELVDASAFYPPSVRGADDDGAWLVDQLYEGVVGALRQVVAAKDPAELVHSIDVNDLRDLLAGLDQRISQTPRIAAAATRTLPPDIAGFTGRSADLNKLMSATKASSEGRTVRIHAIDGMAGVGKTAVAIHAAHMLVDRFPDGQLYLPLHGHTPGRRPVDASDALGTLLLIRGLTARQIPASLDARAALWRDQLANKQVLLLLDDAADSDQVRPLLPASPNCLVLITSRSPLTALEEVTPLSLDMLAPEEAARMFVRQARRPNAEEDWQAVLKLVELCGYLPLAISLMAGRFRHRHTWTVGRLVEDLAGASDRLAEMYAENRSVAAAFDLSYHELPPVQQQLFRRLSLHPGTEFDAYAAAALQDTALTSARRDLADLCEHHLLRESQPGRYVFHDLIRYQARALEATEPATAQRDALTRLFDQYLRTVSNASAHFTRRPGVGSDVPQSQPPDAPQFLSRTDAAHWLETERANLSAVIERAAQPPAARHAYAIPSILSDYLLSHDDLSHVRSLNEAALAAAESLDDLLGQAGAINRLGGVHQRSGHFSSAADFHMRALHLYEDLGHQLAQANVLNNLGSVQRQMGHYEAAVGSHRRALGLYEELGSLLGQANALNTLGVVQRRIGNHAAAAASQRCALELYQELNDRYGQADALNELGSVQRQMGDHAAAMASHLEALEIYQQLRGGLGPANALSNVGIVQQLTGDLAGASAAQRRALEIYKERGDRFGRANALHQLGIVQRLTGEPAAAAASQQEALQIYRDLGNRLGQANVLSELGNGERLGGHHTAARAYLEQALVTYRELSELLGEAEALNNLGDVHRAAGEPSADATACYSAALDIAQRMTAHLEEARALEGLGNMRLLAGDALGSISYLNKALDIYKRLGSPYARRVQDFIDEANL